MLRLITRLKSRSWKPCFDNISANGPFNAGRSHAQTRHSTKAVSALVILGVVSSLYLNRVHADFEAPGSYPYILSRIVEQRISQFGTSFKVPNVGFSAYYTGVPSRDTYVHDGCSINRVELKGRTWISMVISEGANGSHTSQALFNSLLTAITGAYADLLGLYESRSDSAHDIDPSSEDIDNMIKETFLNVDNDIVEWTAHCALETPGHLSCPFDLKAAQSGASALASFYDAKTRSLRTANTGAFRAVIGRRVGTTYKVEEIGRPHIIDNPSEVRRLSSEHPGEDSMLSRIGITRMFGNGPLKWSREIQEKLFLKRLGDPVPPDIKTPPYITAEPEILTTQVKPDDVVVFGSPGLWDALTSEEAVGLVGAWLQNQQISDSDQSKILRKDDLPITLKEDNTHAYNRWAAKKEFVLKNRDDASAHLARNALGGSDERVTAWLLQMPSPMREKWMKDLKVAVFTFSDPT